MDRAAEDVSRFEVTQEHEYIWLQENGFKYECTGTRGFMRAAGNYFILSCLHHDVNYTVGGSERDREIADRGFYRRAMMNSTAEPRVRKIWAYLLIATLWYIAVRLFGWIHFRYGPTKLNKEQALARNKLYHGRGPRYWEIVLRLRELAQGLQGG